METQTRSRAIAQSVIDQAAMNLLDAAPAGSEVILFGSHARGEAGAHSDADFLVIEPAVSDPWRESVRLRRRVADAPLAMDVIVVSRSTFERRKDSPGNLVSEALREGKVYRRDQR
jgi:predicted nucleotidyltransferase